MPRPQKAWWNEWRLEALLQAATFSVYGLLGTPFGLILHSIGGSGAPAANSHLDLDFLLPGVSDNQPGVRLSSGCFPLPSLSPSLDWRTLPSTTPVYDVDGNQFERFASLEAVRTSWTSSAPVLVEHCSLVGQPFWGRLQVAGPPDLGWSFRFQSEGGPAELWGRGWKLSKAHLFTLLDQLVIINQHADLLAQYQAEFESWRHPA